MASSHGSSRPAPTKAAAVQAAAVGQHGRQIEEGRLGQYRSCEDFADSPRPIAELASRGLPVPHRRASSRRGRGCSPSRALPASPMAAWQRLLRDADRRAELLDGVPVAIPRGDVHSG